MCLVQQGHLPFDTIRSWYQKNGFGTELNQDLMILGRHEINGQKISTPESVLNVTTIEKNNQSELVLSQNIEC